MKYSLPDSADVHRLHRLLHELCELGSDTRVWRERLLISMEKMLDAQMSVSYVFDFSLDPNDIAPKTVVYLERGTNEAWRRYLAAGDVSRDPVTPHIMRRLGTDFTVLREEFVDDATWQASDHFRDVIAPANMGDILYSQVGVKNPRVVDGFSAVRSFDKPRFTLRDVALVRFIHEELARLWNREDRIGVHTLPARQREVLAGIRRGESRRTIAEKMGVSVHTVHTYERALFERAGVSSRGALLASSAGLIRPDLLPSS